jgi:hypothetical protein
MICGHRQHSISREIGGRHAGYWLAIWWPMPSSVFLVEPTRVEAGDQGISFSGDRIAIGARGSLGASSNKRAGEISSF